MVRNIQKGAMELSSDGPKMVGGRYGLAENGLKWSKSEEKSGDPRWPHRSFAGPIRERPAAAGRENLSV